MRSPLTPQSQDWDLFWQKEKVKKETGISWSKKRMLKVIEPFMNSGKKALEAGCGSGFFSKYFLDRGMHTTAVDYSPEALEMTRQKTLSRARVHKLDLVADNLSGILTEKFDVIFSDGLLEHFSCTDQGRIINNLKSVLCPPGVLITFVPNRFSPWELIRPFFMPGIDETPFTLKELTDLNERNNLKIMARGGVNTLPFLFSPEGRTAEYFGMLLYTISKIH